MTRPSEARPLATGIRWSRVLGGGLLIEFRLIAGGALGGWLMARSAAR